MAKYPIFVGLTAAALLCCSPVRADVQEFEVRMPDVGDGLCVLVRDGGHYLLYDGGASNKEGIVAAYLEEHSVIEMDYIIVSDYDETHINGLTDVLEKVDTDKILCPDYEDDTEAYRTFMASVEKSGAEIVHPVQGETFKFGDAEIEILSPEEDDSLSVRVTCGDTSWLLHGTGSEIETDEDLKSNVLVTGQNGFSLTDDFLKFVDPDWLLISCADATQSTGRTIYRTDKQGEIVAQTDGKTISFNKEPEEESITITTPEGDSSISISISSGGDATTSIVCDEEAKVIHASDCSEVSKIKDGSLRYTNETSEELIKQGYTACEICNP